MLHTLDQNKIESKAFWKNLLPNLQWRFAALRNGFQDATAYRMEFLLEVVGYAIVPAATQWILWYSLFVTGNNTSIAGRSYSEVLQYTFVSMLFSQIRGGNHDFELAEMIRDGSLSQYLLKPVGVLEFVYIRGVAPKLLITGIGTLIGIGVSLYLQLPLIYIPIAILIAIMGNIIHYQIGAIIAASAFAWEEAYSLLMVKNVIVGLLCGELIPLYLFPESYSWLWKYTPFYLYVYEPTQIFLGKASWTEINQSVIIGMLWIVSLSFLTKKAWNKGIHQYQSLGG
jgi:ABC-2 type transport system permease protein